MASQAVEKYDNRDLIEAILDAVNEFRRHGDGDVLVFLPGEREIREAAQYLRRQEWVGVEVLPLYARLNHAEQRRIFHPTGQARRIVLATNVAERSEERRVGKESGGGEALRE